MKLTPTRLAPLLILILPGTFWLVASAQEANPAEKKQPYVGVYTEGVTLEGEPARTAIRIIGIFPGSPAETAGLKVGDVIVELEGKPFAVAPAQAPNDFRARVIAHEPGDRVDLTVLRETFTVDTGKGPEWADDLPDLKKLVEESPGKVARVSAERARWTKAVA